MDTVLFGVLAVIGILVHNSFKRDAEEREARAEERHEEAQELRRELAEDAKLRDEWEKLKAGVK